MIVSHFFENIDNDDVIAKCKEHWIASLLMAINHAIADEGLELERVTAASTGITVEETLRALPIPTQVRIIYEVIVNPKNHRIGKPTKESKEDAILKREGRRFKLFQYRFIKLTLWSLFLGFILLMAVTGYMAITSKTAPNSDLISNILKTITELFKIIFTL
jgi:hypothetical protein